MEEWKEYKLGDLSLGKGSYGIGAAAVPYSPVLHTYLRITDINDDGTLNKAGLMSVNDDNAEDYILQPNDIVFARTGNSTGRTYFYNSSDGELVYAGFLIKFSLDEKKVNPRILKFYTHSKPYYDWVRSFDTGGTRGNINANTYASMPIVLPPRNLQDKIVSILSSLDDKIELNRKINANLEAQAQALFKSWFVDFEPFKDQPFIESELGMIPEGWRVYCLSEFLPVITGKKDANVAKGGPYPFFSCSQDFGWTDDYSFEGNAILVAGNGDFNVKMYNGKFEAYQRTYVLIPHNPQYTAWLFYAVKYHLNDITSAARGSVIKFITKGNLADFKFTAPQGLDKAEIIEKFDCFRRIIASNEQQSRRLAELRDTLLPKLMSGELKVNEIDKTYGL